MNCAFTQEQLVEQAYGELEPRAAEELTKHLESCSACTAFQQNLEHELSIFGSFGESSQLTPNPAMWSAIQDQIKEIEPRGASSAWWQRILESLMAPTLVKQAVFAILLVAASAGITSYYFISHKSTQVEVTTFIPPKVDFSPVPKKSEAPAPSATPEVEVKPRPVRKPNDDEILDLQVRRAAREYENAIKLLDRSIAKRKSELDPDSIRLYEVSLAQVNESIESCRTALREHPKDALTARFLLSAYSRKVELMQEIAMR